MRGSRRSRRETPTKPLTFHGEIKKMERMKGDGLEKEGFHP